MWDNTTTPRLTQSSEPSNFALAILYPLYFLIRYNYYTRILIKESSVFILVSNKLITTKYLHKV